MLQFRESMQTLLRLLCVTLIFQPLLRKDNCRSRSTTLALTASTGKPEQYWSRVLALILHICCSKGHVVISGTLQLGDKSTETFCSPSQQHLTINNINNINNNSTLNGEEMMEGSLWVPQSR